MKYLKMLALAAVTVGALMAFVGAGTASASKLCSTTADPCPAGQHWPLGTEFDFSLLGSSVETDTAGEPINTCTKSTIKGKTTNTGSSAETVTVKITSWTFEGCTFPGTTNKLGGLEIHNIAGTFNGTVTADGITERTINTVFFGSCVYGVTSGQSLGDLTEGIGQTATTGGQPAILHINTITHKLSGSNLACPETIKWTATFQLTSPIGTTLAVTKG